MARKMSRLSLASLTHSSSFWPSGQPPASSIRRWASSGLCVQYSPQMPVPPPRMDSGTQLVAGTKRSAPTTLMTPSRSIAIEMARRMFTSS